MAAAATMLPLAISMIPGALSLRRTAQPAPPPQISPTATPKHFSIPLNDLRQWASAVLVTMNDVTIEGASKVHKQEADCEIHFGAHAPGFKGQPAGLVLEPMNACTLPFPGQTEQKDSDWTKFADSIKNKTVTVIGVPRIWPEHLTGGGASNPDHAVELHPLTEIDFNGKPFNFVTNISAGEFRGGVSLPTAQAIVKQTIVNVTRNGNNVDIDFFGGRIGNFTVLDVNVDTHTIAADSGGSFRMSGEVVLDNGESIPVRMVTIKDSPFNQQVGELQTSGRVNVVNLGEVLVLFSLNPESLLDAANKSNGQPVTIQRPIQLILYGPPD